MSLAELTSGVLVLLALGIAAALTALLTALGAPFEWQLVGMGVFSGILVPIAIRWIKPRFSPKGVAYGTTGEVPERHARRREPWSNRNGEQGALAQRTKVQLHACIVIWRGR